MTILHSGHQDPYRLAVGPGNGTAIANAIAATGPGGNTPTRDAITNGGSYLAGLTDTNPKYLLLATDGLPNCPVGCSGMARPSSSCTMTDNPTEDMAAEQAVLAAAAHGFKTFVIGIGNVSTAVATLDAMAVGGGEAQAARGHPLLCRHRPGRAGKRAQRDRRRRCVLHDLTGDRACWLHQRGDLGQRCLRKRG